MLRRTKAWLYLSAALLVFEAVVPGIKGNESSIAYAKQASSIPLKPITKFAVGKARYNPGEKVTFTLQFDQSKDWSGKLNIRIYQLDTLVAEGSKPVTVLSSGSGSLEVGWTPPSTDYRGYLAKAWFDDAPDEAMTAAVDVSSDWTHFPRYGYVTEFPKEPLGQSDAKLKQLSQDYYLNGYQFYDWMWRHDVSVYSKTDDNGNPLRDENGGFISAPVDENTSITDLLGRSLYPLTIKQEVAAAQKYGSAAMAYEMNYAARENYEKFGVKPEWGLYNKDAKAPFDPLKDQVGFFFDGVKPNPTALYLQDPGNPEWRAYITKEFNRAVNEYGFDGIHLDQWGASDNDYLLDYTGNKRYYSLDFNKIINDTKDALTENNSKKNDVTFNMVGGNAGYSTVPAPGTKTDFDYSEIWQDKDRYKDLKQVINDTRSKNGHKAMVIAGYMNYKQATGISVDAASALDVPHTVTFQSRINKAPGWVGDFGKKDEDQIEFTVDAPEAGDYNLKLYYGHGNDAGSPEGYLTVNGVLQADHIAFDQKTDWGNPVAVKEFAGIPLKAGENKIKLQLHSNDLWLNIARLEAAGHGLDKMYQAVFANLISCKVDQYGNVYYFETDGDYVTFHVNVPSEGDYPIAVSYSVDKEAVSRNLYVNGDANSKQEVAFPSTGDWKDFRETAPVTVHLQAGDNTVTLKDEGSNDTGVKLQYLSLNGERYMAEFADTGWAPTQPALITKVPAVVAGKQVQNLKNGPDTIEFTIPSDAAVTKSVYFSYATANNVNGTLQINGSTPAPVSFASSGGWSGDGKLNVKPVSLPLIKGENKVRLSLENENNYLNLESIYLNRKRILVDDPSVVVTGGVQIVNTGDKAKTDNFGAGSVTFTAESDTDQDATLRLYYRSDMDLTWKLTVAGTELSLSTSKNGWYGDDWWKSADLPVHLNAGSNTIKAEVTNGYANLHGIDLLSNKFDSRAAAVNGIDNSKPFTDGFGGMYDTATIPVTGATGGDTPVVFHYKSNADLHYQLFAGDNQAPVDADFPGTGGAQGEHTLNVTLPPGDSTIRLQPEANLTDSIQLDKIDVGGTTIEAEDPAVKLTGGAEVAADAASAGYIDSFKQQGDYVQLQLANVTESGAYPLTVTYKNSGGAAVRSVYVNGRKAGSIELPSTGDSWSTATVNVYLKSSATDNEIMVKKEDGKTEEAGIQIDKLVVGGMTLEAEDGAIGWQPVVPRTGSITPVIGQTDDFGKAGQSVTFTIDAAEDVDHFDVLYRTDNNPVVSVLIDGVTAAASVPLSKTSGGWGGAFAAKTVKAKIAAGKHTVTLKMESDGQYVNVSSIVVGGDEYAVANAALTEAGGTPVKTKIGYADDFNDDGDFVTFNVKVPAEGSYNLVWKYVNETREVSREVVVNDAAPQTAAFPVHASWSDVTMSGVELKAGLNQVTIKVAGAEDDGIKLDALKVEQAASAFSKIYEAEKADFLPPMTFYKDTILNFGHIGDSVSFDIDVPQDGEASLIYTYSNPGSTTSRAVFIDGVRQNDLSGQPGRIYFDGTGSTESYSEDGYFIVPFLAKGTHRVTLKADELSEKGNIRIKQLTLGYFNEPSLRLMDAGLAALGATHIELGTAENIADGPNMLAHEYYPNRSKKLLNSTKANMMDYFKFNAAYENLLFDSREDTAAKLEVAQNGSLLPLSQDGARNTLWYTVRKNDDNKGFERYDVIHLINMLNNDDNWRNAADDPTEQTNLKVTYPIGISEKDAKKLKVFAATPDADHGMFKELNYAWDGTNLIIDLPSLQYWSMIFIDKDPQKAKVDKLFAEHGESDSHPGNGKQNQTTGELSGGADQDTSTDTGVLNDPGLRQATDGTNTIDRRQMDGNAFIQQPKSLND
ncbi:glycoside hydrolase family 66 protein [Paenibacillus beijingensis]|uniref:glycoside hydrolase family 66 protein n=1 Tax=Paenibacillus beijingensis TaxID=1126833 RepID=UPI000697892D|nr:glycoside hydrolase family 66 protein [Paenibacillus beijingensis]